jgi:outer membrane receptor protein involved in Fe transport
MKIIRLYFFLSFFCAFSQTKTSIQGNVLFGKTLVSDAHIEIYINDKIVTTIVSDKNGRYFSDKIFGIKQRLKVKISHIEYKSEEIIIEVTDSNNSFDFNFIEKATYFLDEVVLSNKEKFIQHEADKSIITVQNNDLLSNGSTFEAITKLPGVIITNEGFIGLNGKLSTIFIDGEPTGISGENLIAFLNSLPANTINRIELIQNPGAKYSASFTGGIINIITNSLKTKGYSITLNNSSRINQNFKVSNSLQLLLKKNKFNYDLFLGSNISNSDRHEEYKSTLENQNNIKIIEKREPEFRNEGVYFRNRFNYSFSKNTSFIINFNHNSNRDKNLLQSTNLNSNFEENQTTETHNFQKNNYTNNEFILKVKQKLDTIGSNVEATFYSNNFNSDNQSRLSEFSSNNRFSKIALNSFSKNKIFRVDSEFPLKKINSTLYFGFNLGKLDAENEGYYILNSFDPFVFESNDFDSTIPFVFENINYAFYNSISTKIKKFNFSFGLRFEKIRYQNYLKNQTDQINKTSFSNFFPNLNFLYQYNDFINLSMNYNRKINLPSSNNFDPNFNQASFYYNDTGNPLLEAEISNNFNSKVTFFDYAYLGYSISYLSHRNVPFYISNTNSIGVTQTLFSLENTYNQTINLGVPIPFALFSKGLSIIDEKDSLDINNISYFFIDVSYNQINFNNALYSQYEKGNFMLYLYSQIVLHKNLKMFINYNFTSKGSISVFNINEPINNFDLHFSTKFLKKSLRVDIGVYNLLNTSGYEISFTGENINSFFRRINENRMFRLSLTYNFGSFKNTEKENFRENKSDLLDR